MEQTLGGKTVTRINYVNDFGEVVSYLLTGTRGAVIEVIRYGDSDQLYMRNRDKDRHSLSICSLWGNSTLTDKTGILNYLEC